MWKCGSGLPATPFGSSCWWDARASACLSPKSDKLFLSLLAVRKIISNDIGLGTFIVTDVESCFAQKNKKPGTVSK